MAEPAGQHVLARVQPTDEIELLEHDGDPAPLAAAQLADVDAAEQRLARRRAGSSAARHRNSVVLPAPLGPSTATNSPGATRKLTASIALTPP